MKNKIFLFIIIISFNIMLSGQENNSKILNLSLEDSKNLALANNLDINIAELNLSKYKWALALSWNSFIPNADISIVPTSLQSDITVFEPWLAVTYSFNTKAIFEISQTALEYRYGTIQFEIAKKKIYKNTKEIYYNLLLSKYNLNIFEKNLETAEIILNIENKKFENKINTKYDKLTAEYKYEDAKIKLKEQENSYNNYLLTFKKILGIKNDIQVSLTDRLEISNNFNVNSIQSMDYYINKNLDIKTNEINLNILRNNILQNISISTPSINIAYYKNIITNDDISWNSHQNNSFDFYIKIPVSSLIPFSSNQLKIINSNIDIMIQKDTIGKLKKDKEIELIKIIQDINKNFSLIESLKIRFSIAEEKFKLLENLYKSGIKSYLDIKDAESDYNDSELSLINAKYNLLTSINNLEYF